MSVGGAWAPASAGTHPTGGRPGNAMQCTCPHQATSEGHVIRAGPCVDADVAAFVTRSDDFELETRWPLFTKAALAAGVRSMLLFRLYTRADHSGDLEPVRLRTEHLRQRIRIHRGGARCPAAIAITAGRTKLNSGPRSQAGTSSVRPRAG